jgi:hypothetical protein
MVFKKNCSIYRFLSEITFWVIFGLFEGFSYLESKIFGKFRHQGLEFGPQSGIRKLWSRDDLPIPSIPGHKVYPDNF